MVAMNPESYSVNSASGLVLSSVIAAAALACSSSGLDESAAQPDASSREAGDARASGGSAGKTDLPDTAGETFAAPMCLQWEQRLPLPEATDAADAMTACVWPLPTPPDGGTLDPTRVNLLVSTDGSSSFLLYSPTCTPGGDWHYDNASQPTEIILCPDECAEVTATSSSELLFDRECPCGPAGVCP